MHTAPTHSLLGFRKKAVKPARLPKRIRSLCRHRALKRWSALLTQHESRIGVHMRKRLGEAHWAEFVRYAICEHKATFAKALMHESLCCEGKVEGTPCAHGRRLDLLASSVRTVGDSLPTFHLDHTYDVAQICDAWSRALPPNPSSWDDGICGPLVAHLLFGTRDHPLALSSRSPLWRRQIKIRCGNKRGAKGKQQARNYCHDVAMAHYDHVLRVSDLRVDGRPDDGADDTEDESGQEVHAIDVIDLTA